MAVSESYLRSLDCSNEAGAKEYLASLAVFVKSFENKYGMVSKKFKPFPIEFPWAMEKKKEANITLGLYYWQMPYEEAVKVERGLSYKRWQEAVSKNCIVQNKKVM